MEMLAIGPCRKLKALFGLSPISKELKQDNGTATNIQAEGLPSQNDSEYEQGVASTTAALLEHLTIHKQAEEDGEQAVNELLGREGDVDDMEDARLAATDEMDIERNTPAFVTQEMRRDLFD